MGLQDSIQKTSEISEQSKIIRNICLLDISEGYKTMADREQKAADRIFGILPQDQGNELMELWREFERMDTPESRFACVLDRMQPLLLNYTKGGISWQSHGVNSEQVRGRNQCIRNGSEQLYNFIMEIIDDAVEKGYLKK